MICFLHVRKVQWLWHHWSFLDFPYQVVSVYMPCVYCCSSLEGGQCVLCLFGDGDTCRGEALLNGNSTLHSTLVDFLRLRWQSAVSGTNPFSLPKYGHAAAFPWCTHCDFFPFSYVTTVPTSLKSDFISLIKHIMSLSKVEVSSMINEKVLWTGCKEKVIYFWHLLFLVPNIAYGLGSI